MHAKILFKKDLIDLREREREHEQREAQKPGPP